MLIIASRVGLAGDQKKTRYGESDRSKMMQFSLNGSPKKILVLVNVKLLQKFEGYHPQ